MEITIPDYYNFNSAFLEVKTQEQRHSELFLESTYGTFAFNSSEDCCIYHFFFSVELFSSFFPFSLFDNHLCNSLVKLFLSTLDWLLAEIAQLLGHVPLKINNVRIFRVSSAKSLIGNLIHFDTFNHIRPFVLTGRIAAATITSF